MPPSEQGFRSHDPPSGKLKLWLILEKELFLLESPSQSVFHSEPLKRLAIHLLGEEPPAVPSAILGGEESNIGVFEQGFRVRTVHREKTDPNAAGSGKADPIDDEVSREFCLDSIGSEHGVSAVLDCTYNNYKLVATQASHGIVASRAFSQPLCDLLQNNVSGRMPQRVIHIFKAVKINE